MLIACPACGKRISDRAPACPFCKATVLAPAVSQLPPQGTPDVSSLAPQQRPPVSAAVPSALAPAAPRTAGTAPPAVRATHLLAASQLFSRRSRPITCSNVVPYGGRRSWVPAASLAIERILPAQIGSLNLALCSTVSMLGTGAILLTWPAQAWLIQRGLARWGQPSEAVRSRATRWLEGAALVALNLACMAAALAMVMWSVGLSPQELLQEIM